MKKETKFKQTEIGIIPEDWEIEQLGNLCDITSSKRIFLNEYVSEGIPFYRSKEIILLSDNQIITDTLFISQNRFKEISEKFGSPKEGDLLMTSVGTLGVPYIVKKGEVFYFKDGNLMWFKSFKSNLKNKFLYYWIKSPIGQQQLDAVAIGSTQKALTIDSLKRMKFTLPEINEQEEITKILSDLDSKIELNQQVNKTLEAIGQAIFKRWFVDFEFPNEKGKPYKSSGGEMVDSELGEIPKGWQVGKILDICSSITSGGTPKRMETNFWGGKIAWFKTGELTDGPLLDSEEHISEDGLKNSACKLWDINTVLIALYASPTVGRLGLLKTKATSNQACSGLVAKKEIGYAFLFLSLFNKRDELNSFAVGAAQQNINQNVLKETKIIIPKTELLSEFNKIQETIFNKLTFLVFQINYLTKIRDSLLPRLMSGKIRVPVEV